MRKYPLWALATLFLTLFAAPAIAGPYVGLGGEYSWKDRSDIGQYTVQPIVLAGFEFVQGPLALDLEGSHGFPYSLFDVAEQKRYASVRATFKLRF